MSDDVKRTEAIVRHPIADARTLDLLDQVMGFVKNDFRKASRGKPITNQDAFDIVYFLVNRGLSEEDVEALEVQGFIKADLE